MEQNFESYPKLADHIFRMASTGNTGSIDQWNHFLRDLNQALAVTEDMERLKISMDDVIAYAEYKKAQRAEMRFINKKDL